ncbi:MAG: ABC transporter permease [bacterium]|nr:ABC transporter permease [bacterium]
MKRLDGLQLAFSALGGIVLLFILAPLVGVFLRSGQHSLVLAAADPEVRASIGLTLWTSMAATLCCALPAIPLAWLLARRRFPLRGLVMGVIDLPIIIPHSAAGIALLGVLARHTPAGTLAGKLGISFVSTPAGIMAAMAFVSLPFLVNAARTGFQEVPERLEKAALNLGASPLRVFLTVSMPLARRSILTGLVLMWARGMSEFGAVIIMAYHPTVAPVMIYERFSTFGLAHALPVTALFILVCLALFVALKALAGDSRRVAP